MMISLFFCAQLPKTYSANLFTEIVLFEICLTTKGKLGTLSAECDVVTSTPMRGLNFGTATKIGR